MNLSELFECMCLNCKHVKEFHVNGKCLVNVGDVKFPALICECPGYVEEVPEVLESVDYCEKCASLLGAKEAEEKAELAAEKESLELAMDEYEFGVCGPDCHCSAPEIWEQDGRMKVFRCDFVFLEHACKTGSSKTEFFRAESADDIALMVYGCQNDEESEFYGYVLGECVALEIRDIPPVPRFEV